MFLFRRCLAMGLVALGAAPSTARAALWALLLAPGALAQTVTVTTANSPYVIATPTTVEQLVVESGGTLLVNAKLSTSGDFTVKSRGRVTMGAGVFTLELVVGGTLALELDGAIDVAGLGVPAGQTIDRVSGAVVPYPRTSSSSQVIGGSHLAPGGRAESSLGFDTPSDPRLPGGGGDLGFLQVVSAGTCSGGGVVIATATALVIDGTIRADGAPNDGAWCGSGAGGSINLFSPTVQGSGTLSVQGGTESHNGHSGACGAGGLVRIAAGAPAFSGLIEVQGGRGCGVSGIGSYPAGGTGSAVIVDLVAKRLTVVAGEYPLRGGEVYEQVSVAPGATLRLEGPAKVALPVAPPAGATIVVASSNAFDRMGLASGIEGTLQVDAPVVSSGALLLAGTLVVNERFVLPSLKTQRGAIVTHSAQLRTMHLVVSGTLEIGEGARVEAVGKGLPGEMTAGAISLAAEAGSGHVNGGSHAGLGGVFDLGAALAPIFDDPADPRAPGGGGGNTGGVPRGGPGGGVVRISAGRLILGGDIVADGSDSLSGVGAGGGAGGTVALRLGELTGAGRILARGSPNPILNAGGGGGGIINLATAATSFTGTKSVAGGLGLTPGQPGVLVETTASLSPAIVTEAPPRATPGTLYGYAPLAAGTPPFAWRLGAGPSGATADASSGTVRWLPEFEGAFDFELSVSNALGTGTQRFTVTVSRDAGALSSIGPPRITSTPDTAGRCGVQYRYSGAGSPVVEGRGPFSFSIASALGVPLPSGLTVDETTGALAWTPSPRDVGARPLELRVVGPEGAARQSFAIVVDCPDPERLRVGCGCASTPTWMAACVLAGLLSVKRRRRPRRGDD